MCKSEGVETLTDIEHSGTTFYTLMSASYEEMPYVYIDVVCQTNLRNAPEISTYILRNNS